MAEVKEMTNNEETKEVKVKVFEKIKNFCGKPAVKKTAKIIGYGGLIVATGLGALAGIDTLGKRSGYIDIPKRPAIPEEKPVDTVDVTFTEEAVKEETVEA